MRTVLLAVVCWVASPWELFGQSPGLGPVPVPVENPITANKALLGKTLFWDEQLSGSGTVACGTCHVLTAGGSDPRTLNDPAASTHPGPDHLWGTADDIRGSQGLVRRQATGAFEPDSVFGLRAQVTRRTAPSVINAAYAPTLFWDGRASGTFTDPVTHAVIVASGGALESQAAEPPTSSIEMAHVGEDWVGVAARVASSVPLRLAETLPPSLATFAANRSYPELFDLAFGTPDVTPARILMALATYQRTLISDQSPWDDFLAGNTQALTNQQLNGRDVFFGVGRCDLCHTGPRFTDDDFHDLGMRPDQDDLGRAEVTGLVPDEGRFRTPSLRNVALRGPYFHNGSRATLGSVMSFYRTGGGFEADPLMQPVNLSPSQRLALVAFLNALTDPRVAQGLPPFDRPTLYTESQRVPQLIGSGSPGTGGVPPVALALDPPFAGNRRFSLGLHGSQANAPAYLFFDPIPSAPPQPLAGAEIHLAMSPGLFGLDAGPLTGGAGGTQGFTTLTFDLRGIGPWVGAPLWGQWLIQDPGAAQGIATSAGFRIQFF